MRHVMAMAIFGMMLSCGGDGSSGGSASSSPASSQIESAQESDAASGGTETMMRAATDAVTADGTNGETTASRPASEGDLPAAPPAPRAGFNFQGQIDVTVNLSLLPNASGQLSVSASGTVSGDNLSGSASYAVSVSCLTDCTFTDPASGQGATVSAGSGFTFQLDVAWTWTAPGDWSVTWTSSLSLSGLAATTSTEPATVSGDRQAAGSAVSTAGVKTWTYDASGTWTVSTSLHLVEIDTALPGGVTITIDGFPFGPYPWQEVLQIFGFVP